MSSFQLEGRLPQLDGHFAGLLTETLFVHGEAEPNELAELQIPLGVLESTQISRSLFSELLRLE